MEQRQYGKLTLQIYDDKRQMGEAAAVAAGTLLNDLLAKQEQVNCIFAAAPSQSSFLEALCKEKVAWDRINVFHMDDYLGFEQGDPRSFNGFLTRYLFGRLPFASVNLLNGKAVPEEECARYSRLLREYPVDITFMGIGENGHIAFNDPPADFDDPQLIKVVKLDMVCRRQQVHDKCFPSLEEVPTHAMSLTIPALLRAKHIFCIVPGAQKAQAAALALTGPLSEQCPASILKTHPDCRMYIDKDCASQL